MIDLRLGDCLDVLRTMPDESVDAIVTDPPYGLAFMGKQWDYDVPSVEIWQECLRVLKPGGHLLAFAGTRTQHRMCVRIEDAGFEIRDMIAWVYGSGFPKSHDVSKATDKAAGAERQSDPHQKRKTHYRNALSDGCAAVICGICGKSRNGKSCKCSLPPPVTDAARQWQGWGTALKPALEPITVARKPLTGTVADNVMRYGTGAINVDGCRVKIDGPAGNWGAKQHAGMGYCFDTEGSGFKTQQHPHGRWPANLIHDGSDEVVGLFPGDEGRFFYCPKASKRDRDEGLSLPARQYSHDGRTKPIENAYQRNNSTARNNHPTVKPTDLMRYLCRLVTPPGGTVLDPFMGSGSTGKAAALEGFQFVGIEREDRYMDIARARIEAAKPDEVQLNLL
jgi:site-specific DNA-methyltransferase (adenine-specific)